MSLFERIKNKRYDLQERKKENPPPKGDGSGEPVTTNTNRNPLDTIFGDNKNKKQKKFVNQNERPKGETPPKNEKPLTKHQRLRQQVETGRKKYNLKPDSRGIYKPTKSSVLGSIETNIKKSSTPPKVKAKMTPGQLLKFNKQQRRSQKYSGNENNKRVQKILQRVAKNQKIDKSKAGLVQRQKDLAYGKNPYKPKFGSVNLNLQKKYDDMMLKYGGKDSKLMTQKQIDKLKKTIATKELKNPAKTMTYLAPAGSGKPVPLKTRRIKKIVAPEIEKIIPKASKLTKLSKHLLKNKNKYLVGAGLTLAGLQYIRGRNKVKQAEKERLNAIAIKTKKDDIQPFDSSLFLNKTGTSPTQTAGKYDPTKIAPYAKPTQKSSNVNRNKLLP